MSLKIKNLAIGVLAALAVLAPLKFGTPVVLPAPVLPPQTILEWLFFSWPNQLLSLVAAVAVIGLALDAQWLPVRRDWLWVLPGLFLATQLAAAPTSICLATTMDTLLHLGACVLVFYLAARYVREPAAVAWVFGGLTVATLVIVAFAAQQYFGGLAATREYAAVYGGDLPKDLQLRLTSNRVFSTLVYPNALAGYLVVAFAPVMAWVWSCRLRDWLKWVALVCFAGAMVFCLALTGSRGGFIAFAVMVIAVLLLWRGKLFTSRWMLWILMLCAPFPYIANTAGWLTAELGRQPWLVYGLMRTEDGYSKAVSAGNGMFTLLGFMGMYMVLGILGLFLLRREIEHGPAGLQSASSLGSATEAL